MLSHLKTYISEQVIISSNALDDILSHFYHEFFSVGNHFTEPGKNCRNMAYISSGIIQMYNVADGKKVTLWIGIENRLITDLRSFVQQTPARINKRIIPSQLYSV